MKMGGLCQDSYVFTKSSASSFEEAKREVVNVWHFCQWSVTDAVFMAQLDPFNQLLRMRTRKLAHGKPRTQDTSTSPPAQAIGNPDQTGKFEEPKAKSKM